MSGGHPGDPAGRTGPQWPMAPGVPGSAQAREARTIVGLPADASDAEFIGASASDGRDALVSAARRRLEPVLAAHGANSRESWLVDHELKSALGRVLASTHAHPAAPQPGTASPPAQQVAPRTHAPPSQHPTPHAAAAAHASPRASSMPQLDVARALYARRSPIGRAMLALGMQAQQGERAPVAVSDAARGAGAAPGHGDHDTGIDTSARTHVRGRSRARIIAATIAVLSAIGLVIEIAYVPVHLQRARAVQRPAESAPSTVSKDAAPAGQRTTQPAPQPDLRGGELREPGTAAAPDRTADGSGAPQVAGGAPPAARPVPIPSPALPADRPPDAQHAAPSATVETVDPSVRARLDRLAAQWTARISASVDAHRTIGSLEPDPARWLAQARLLERLIALDDIAQLLIEARADDAEPLLDVMPVACDVSAPPAASEGDTSAREDGRLVTDLSRAGGGGESRLAVLRAYRSLPLAPGRADARALVSEALGGPSRNSRALALAILLERGGSSVAVLEAVHARIGELTATPAGRAVVEQLAGELPGGAPLDAQSLRARLSRRILEGRGAPMHLIDATADATAAMLDRMARRADPQVAPADIESSLSTLARAAARDAAPARTDGANGPLQRMVASLAALEGARIMRNYRRLPDERSLIDAAAAASSVRVLSAESSLAQAIAVALGILAQDGIALRIRDLPIAAEDGSPASGARVSANPLAGQAPSDASLRRWSEAARALEDAGAADGDALIRLAEDVQDSSADPDGRAIAARLYARAAVVGSEANAASAARGIASLVPAGAGPNASERHRWESIASQYAMADSAMRGTARMQRRAGSGAEAEADTSTRIALADALALCVSGYGRQAHDRLQSPTVRALLQRLSGALPGGAGGLESLCEGRTPSSPPLEPQVANQLLAVEAALRDPRSTRWSDDLALRRGLPLVSVDTASRAARLALFTPAPVPGPQ